MTDVEKVEFLTEFTDDAGMSKHRLSPYDAYYHN